MTADVSTEDVKRRVLEILDDDCTEDLVKDYLRHDDDHRPWFTGSWFERIDGGGDRDEVKDVFTSADLVAVQMLGVTVSPTPSLWILEQGADRLSECLSAIPVDVSPYDRQGAEMLRDRTSALNRLWRLLHGLDDIGWVTAGKLCARKRPTLAPVYDVHVQKAVGGSSRWWVHVAALFQDAQVLGTLDRLRQAARKADGDLTMLRTLDVAIWMRQHGYQWAARDHQPPGPHPLDA